MESFKKKNRKAGPRSWDPKGILRIKGAWGQLDKVVTSLTQQDRGLGKDWSEAPGARMLSYDKSQCLRTKMIISLQISHVYASSIPCCSASSCYVSSPGPTSPQLWVSACCVQRGVSLARLLQTVEARPGGSSPALIMSSPAVTAQPRSTDTEGA